MDFREKLSAIIGGVQYPDVSFYKSDTNSPGNFPDMRVDNNWYRKAGYIILVLSCSLPVLSQEKEQDEKNDVEQKGAHRITLGLGHTHLAKGKNSDGKTVWLPQASLSLNYDYWISNKWAIGLQTDLVMEKFVVEDENDQDLEREKPFAVVPVGMYKPWKHFAFMAGAGIELEKEENLGLTRLGVEYGCELPKNWEAGIALIWDEKWGHYNSWAFEFSFSKLFLKHNAKK